MCLKHIANTHLNRAQHSDAAVVVYAHYLFRQSLSSSGVLDGSGYSLNDGLGLGLGLTQGLSPVKLQLLGHVSQDAQLH